MEYVNCMIYRQICCHAKHQIFLFSNGGIYLTMTGRLIMIDASNHMCQYVKYVVRSITKKTISTTLLRRSNELDQYFHSNLFVP